MSHPLADAIRSVVTAVPDPIRVAVVSSTSPLEVSMGGGTGLSASRLAQYTTPVVADQVLVLQTDTDLVILGKLVSGG